MQKQCQTIAENIELLKKHFTNQTISPIEAMIVLSIFQTVSIVLRNMSLVEQTKCQKGMF